MQYNIDEKEKQDAIKRRREEATAGQSSEAKKAEPEIHVRDPVAK